MLARIYQLSDQTGPRYVGATRQTLEGRLWLHLRADSRHKNKKAQWLRDLNARGETPKISLLESVQPSDVAAVEKFWIAQGMGLGWDLLNSNRGGGGLSKRGAPKKKKRVLFTEKTLHKFVHMQLRQDLECLDSLKEFDEC